MTFFPSLRRLDKPSRGAGLVDYSILAALISVASIAAVVGLGREVDDNFTTVTAALEDSAPGATPGAGGIASAVIFNNPSTYPAQGDCGAIAANGSFTMGSPCYIAADSTTGITDMTGITEATTVFFNGTAGSSQGPVIQAGGPGVTYIVTDPLFQQTILMPLSSGNHNVSLPTLNCSDVYFDAFTDGGMRGIGIVYQDPVTFDDGAVIITENVNALYCGGDVTVRNWDYMAREGGGWQSNYYVLDGYVESRTDPSVSAYVQNEPRDPLPGRLTWANDNGNTCIYDPDAHRFINFCQTESAPIAE